MISFWKTFKGYILPYKGLAGLNILFNLLGVLFSLFSLVLIGPFLTVLFNAHKVLDSPVDWEFSRAAIEHNFNYYLGQQVIHYGPHKALVFVSILILIMFFLKTACIFMANYFMAPIRNGVVRDIRNSIYKKITYLPISYISEEKKGDIMSRATQDVQEIEWSVMASIEKFFRDPLNIVIFLIGLLMMSPGLTLFVLVLLPLSAVLIGQIGKNLRKTSSLAQSQMGQVMAFLEETLSGLRIVKAFNAENKMGNGFRDLNQNFTQTMNKISRRRYLASPLSEFLGSIVIVILLIFGGNLVLKGAGTISAAGFMAYIAVFSQLLTPAKSFSTAFYHIQKGLASYDRVEEVLQVSNPVTNPDNPEEIKNFNHCIEYRNVSFSYGDKTVLKDVNLSVKKGQTVALVGQSGSGKSTFVDLLLRFYDVNKGQILIDEKPITSLNIKDLRKLIGYVHQEPLLFNDSFENNIIFGDLAKDDKKLNAVLDAALASAFVNEKPEGTRFIIGDKGGKLSGGQKQRISIARALYADPDILILDEATSALDTESESLVQKALDRLMENRTTLVIAHRLNSVKHADQIVVFKEGEIIEKGTHDQLMKQKGEYCRIYTEGNKTGIIHD